MAGGGTATDALSRYEQSLFSRLDRAFEAQAQRLDHEQLASVLRWQRTDRAYEVVQGIARGDAGHLPHGERHTGMRMLERLRESVQSGCLPFPLPVYRGVRDLRQTLGTDDPRQTVGRSFALQGFNAASIRRAVAFRDFTSPRGALFELLLMPRTPALWIAALGRPSLRDQGELLLDDGLHIHVYSLYWEGRLPVLTAEVIEQ